MARFYVLLDAEITQVNAENEIRKFLAPYTVNFTKTEWFSTFEGTPTYELAYTHIYVYSLKSQVQSDKSNLVKERLARTYFSSLGRIILAGDAAHVHAVNGGQGLNTGISDAFALIWRLYLACKGYPSMITSYERERRHIAADVLSIASKLVRSTLRTATEYVEIVENNAAYITGKIRTNI
jgi:phenol 2-monooxygenase (NADPH)